MATVFTRIIKKELPVHMVAEDDEYLAFLDLRPLQKGHVLVIPKVEVAYYFDLPDSVIAGLNVFAKKVAVAIKKAVPCTRIGVVVVGLEVPHAHIHLVPINNECDLSFANTRQKLSKDELERLAERIRQCF